MIKGAKVKMSLYNTIDGVETLVLELKDSECGISVTKYFGLSIPGQFGHFWSNWPKKGEFKAIDNNTAEITFIEGRVIFEFIN